MKTRQITASEWPIISAWYTQDISIFIGKDTGFVTEHNGELIASGFLVLTNAKFVLMEHLQVNPKVNTIRQGRGILHMVSFLERMSKNMGFKCILGFTAEDNSVIRKMHKKVFKAQEIDEPIKVIFKMI